MPKHTAGIICPAIALLILAGCNTSPRTDYEAVELVAGSGTVTLDGEPLADAVVSFEAEEGASSYGVTDDAGHYELRFDSVKDGVTTGKKTVRISTTRKVLGVNSEEEDPGEAGTETETGEAIKKEPEKELVPEKYNVKSELTVEVVPEEKTYDFELKSK